MAKILEDQGHQTLAVGMLNNHPDMLDNLLNACNSAIICNKPNVERKFDKDINENHAKMILDVLEKHKEKIVTCDTVGFDRWGKPMHPELVERCNKYLNTLGE